MHRCSKQIYFPPSFFFFFFFFFFGIGLLVLCFIFYTAFLPLREGDAKKLPVIHRTFSSLLHFLFWNTEQQPSCFESEKEMVT